MTTKRLSVLAKSAVLAAFLFTSQFLTSSESRVALLFGINDYPESGLFSDLG